MEKSVLKIISFAAVISCASLASCLKEDSLKLPFTTYIPVNLNDGWELSTPAQEGVNEAELQKIYRFYHESSDLWQVRSLLVFRNNKLIAESYTKNPDERSRPVPVWSCTKQIMGILTGIAVEQGFIDDIHDHIQKYLPEEISRHPDKGSITIQNLLQMQSGIAFSNDGFNGESNKLLKEAPSGSLDFILGLPAFSRQGEQFHYNDGDPHIISAILQQQTGKTTGDWAKEVLFSKLGMKNYDWAVYKDGITMGGFGIMATPREMARIGSLALNRGNWNGRRIINPAWIDEMTSVKVPKEKVNTDAVSFGYQWWVDESRDIFFMWGKGGQFVIVKPGKNLIMATTADPNDGNAFELGSALNIFDRIDHITN
ncbi:MAG: beta-lactamase family protein [Bacteroidales bacterium]|jgi:CubicO group peptidase (beta-lactamase class C family)|nr:beta-lactamase family protein [Bacteroidales bacterium]